MIGIFTGSLIISLLHALIPNHWLPVVAIGRKEGWSLAKTSQITLLAGLSHVLSTVLIGFILGAIGKELSTHLEHFTHVIAPSILVLLGIYFIREHYQHNHFAVDRERIERKRPGAMITALVVAMFLSPCMEIEGYFLLAGKYGSRFLAALSFMYALISLTGMLIWVRVVYKGLLKLNWHRWEHNAGIITGCTLIGTGIITYFIG
ncbi:MAG: hypothetical protein EOP50_00355 [Sphingobacteriales bacterium]|nr:MAG: hypothetical protein EOP50_00355 [Sphingobacteriales bacterium]